MSWVDDDVELVWFDSIWCGLNCIVLVWFDLMLADVVWFDGDVELAWFEFELGVDDGLIWFDVIWCDLMWFDMVFNWFDVIWYDFS